MKLVDLLQAFRSVTQADFESCRAATNPSLKAFEVQGYAVWKAFRGQYALQSIADGLSTAADNGYLVRNSATDCEYELTEKGTALLGAE